MKTNKILVVVLVVTVVLQSAIASSQNVGIYLNSDDYLNHKLSYSTAAKVKISGLLGRSNVAITSEGKTKTIAKSDLFGYAKDGQDYRFFNNEEYHILCSKGLFIYSHITLVQQGKGPKQTEKYYFSTTPLGTIVPLTLANIKSVYAKYPKFTYSVEGLFKTDSELAAYDTYNKQYKIAWLYAQNVM